MNVYVRRRIVALVVLVLVVWGGVALGRALLGGGSGSSSAAGGTTTGTTAAGPVDTNPVSIARRANVPVLCWHQVRPISAADTESARTYIVTAETLDAQLVALDAAGYTTISGEEYLAHLTRGTALPDKPVMLTFDDGTIGQYTRALPLLQKYGMTATFFPMTVVLGKTDWFTEDMVRELADAGMSVGAHTWDHQQVPGLRTAKDYRTQFVDPKATLERILGKPVTMFAYPFGLWNRAAFPHITSAGYGVAFQLSDRLDRAAPLMTVRRMIVPTWTGPELLRQMAATFPGSGGATSAANSAS